MDVDDDESDEKEKKMASSDLKKTNLTKVISDTENHSPDNVDSDSVGAFQRISGLASVTFLCKNPDEIRKSLHSLFQETLGGNDKDRFRDEFFAVTDELLNIKRMTPTQQNKQNSVLNYHKCLR